MPRSPRDLESLSKEELRNLLLSTQIPEHVRLPEFESLDLGSADLIVKFIESAFLEIKKHPGFYLPIIAYLTKEAPSKVQRIYEKYRQENNDD